MPSTYDYINQLTFSALQHPLQPLLDLAAKKEKDADEARQFKEKVDLLREEGAITAARQRELQDSHLEFLKAQGDLERKNKIAVVEAQSKALVDRLNEVDRAKLRAAHPQRKGESDEAWIARVGEEQAGQLNPLISRMAKLRTDSEKVRDDEFKRRMTAATALARQDPAVIGTIDTLAKSNKSVAELKAKGSSIELIADNLRKIGKGTEATNLENDFRNAVTAKLEGVDERSGRPFVPESPAAIEHLKQLNTEIGQVNQALDIGLRRPDFLGFGHLDFGPNLEKLPPPPPEDPRKKAVADALGLGGTTETGNTGDTVFSGEGGPGDFNSRSFTQRALDFFSGAATKAPGVARQAITPTLPTVPNVARPLVAEAGRTAVNLANPVVGSAMDFASPQIRGLIAKLFGQDAPDLLNDAGKIATTNGIDPESQAKTLQSALSGDPSAQQQVATVLDYVRRSKQAQPYFQTSQPALGPPLEPNSPMAPGGPAYSFPALSPSGFPTR